jgi:hypothetical protein
MKMIFSKSLDSKTLKDIRWLANTIKMNIEVSKITSSKLSKDIHLEYAERCLDRIIELCGENIHE